MDLTWFKKYIHISSDVNNLYIFNQKTILLEIHIKFEFLVL